MSSIELVKMSNKGQLVVPQGIREQAKLNPGERFIAFSIDEGVVFKKVDLPDFESFAKEIETQFKSKKITKKDIKGALKWSRKSS